MAGKDQTGRDEPAATRVLGGPSRTRRALLEAAEELFGAHGYAAVGMRELVARAGVNLSAVKYHFGSKRELYLETVREVVQRPETQAVWAVLEPRPTTVDAAVDSLVRFVRALFETLTIRPELSSCARMMLHEAMDPSEALEDVVVSFTRPNVELLAGVVALLGPEGGHDGPRDRREHEFDARSILGQILHYILLRPIVERGGGMTLSDAATAREAADHVARFSLRGLRVSEERIRRALEASAGAFSDSERGSGPAGRTGRGPCASSSKEPPQ